MAEKVYYLEDVQIYGSAGPNGVNPALAEILMSGRMQAVVAEYTLKVLSNFITRQAAQPYKDWERQNRQGGHQPGQLLENTETTVDIGGRKRDRWVGQITLGVVYGAATMAGRTKYAEYPGNRNLQQALHAVLPNR